MSALKNSEFRERTKQYALRLVKMYRQLPSEPDVQIIARQLFRSGTSIAAHYREATRARSKAEYISKIETAIQEADETMLWMELLDEGYPSIQQDFGPILQETNELISIMVAMVKTSKST